MYRKYPTDLSYSLYKIQRNLARQLSRKAHRTYIRAIQDTLTSPNRPSLYSFVRGLKTAATSRPPIEKMTSRLGQEAVLPAETADVLNDHFTNVGERSSDTWNLLDLPPLPSSPTPLNAIPVSSSIVYKSIKKLLEVPKGKAPGIDGITNEILQKHSDSLAYPLSLSFHLCLSSGCHQTCWKHAVVTAIYKGKGKHNLQLSPDFSTAYRLQIIRTSCA